MNAIIYALVDPFTGLLRYIGKTTRGPALRLRCHLRDKCRCHRTSWIKSVIKRGGKPLIVELETVPADDANDAEISMIAFIRSCGAELVNGTDGGDGMSNPTSDTRRKMSESRRRQPVNRKAIEAMRKATTGLKRPPEFGEMASRRQKIKFQDQSQRDRISKKLKGHPVSSETRSKLADAFRGTKRSAEICQKIADANRRKPPRTEASKLKASIAIRAALHQRKQRRLTQAGQLSIFGE